MGFEDKTSYRFVTFGVMGKYPIALSKNIALFPTAGIEYEFCESVKI
ncbi:MAG: hypothetical protein LBI42_09460 [Chitinispirillales bacterium]|jgi:hypothetical protein|nr:hypothetical protein [Chitinispirillales bacterium]